jgi:caa(3)-type oxidase subunit IV
MSSHAHEAQAPHDGHAGPHRNYVKIWAILLGLLIISVTGPMLGIRLITVITAFGVALVKAYMVAKNFMHLDVEKPFVHWMLVAVLALMVLLWAGVAPDVQKHEGQGWKKPPVATAPAPAHGAHGGGH